MPQPISSGAPPALVWGACGFIGRHLVASLLESGARVSVLTRPRNSYQEPPWASDVEWIELPGDSEDSLDVYRRAVASAPRIFNLAGPSGAAASNADPFHNLGHLRCQIRLLETCAEAPHRPHIVFTSSRLVYGRTGPQAVDEAHSLAPRSMYAAHKIAAENYHRVHALLGNISYTICRVSNAYGYDAAHQAAGCRIINQFIRRSMDGEQISLFGDGGQLRDFIHVSDVVRALDAASMHPAARNEVFNIGSGERTSMFQAADSIRRLTGGPSIQFIPWPNDFALVESGDFVANVDKAERMLGFSPKLDFVSGLQATIGSYARQGETVTAAGGGRLN